MKKHYSKMLNCMLLIIFNSNLHANSTCANTKICPEFQSCKKVAARLPQIDQELDACCTSITTRLNAIINSVANCDQAIAIDQNFVDTEGEIGSSGVYCLVESVTGLLEIDASHVTLNMNGFTLDASTSTEGGLRVENQSYITILGPGVIRSAPPAESPPPLNAGLFFSQTRNVFVDGVRFENNEVGLSLIEGSSGFYIRNCSFAGNGVNAMRFLNSRNGTVACCFVETTTIDQGIFVDSDSSNIRFNQVTVSDSINQNWSVAGTNCSFLDCAGNTGSAGFSFDTTATDCFLGNCRASQNTGDGFVLATGGLKNILSMCQSLNNTGTGFLVQATDTCLQDCLAKENGADGFAVDGALQSYLKGNVAIANTANGYSVSGTDNALLGNYAEANGTNYVGIPDPITTFSISTGMFSPTAFPSIWQNINAQP